MTVTRTINEDGDVLIENDKGSAVAFDSKIGMVSMIEDHGSYLGQSVDLRSVNFDLSGFNSESLKNFMANNSDLVAALKAEHVKAPIATASGKTTLEIGR